MNGGWTAAVGVAACVLAGAGRGGAQADDGPKAAPREVELTVPGEWKSRPAGDDRAAWAGEKTPAKVTVKPGYVYTFQAAPDVTDDQLAGLKALKDVPLHGLTVSSARMSDAGVAHIARLGRLRSLYLSACSRVTDEGLAHLTALADLEELWLTANARVTDEGLKSLAGLKKLRWLSLFGCKRVTDDGARGLGSLRGLKFVFLGGTGVTAAGAADLQKALPECEVKR
jgi:hypothetical protein